MNKFTSRNPFSQVAESLVRISVNTQQTKKVPYGDYKQFKKEFVFDKLKGKRFGESFCEKFEITDYMLSSIRSDEEADSIIQLLGYLH